MMFQLVEDRYRMEFVEAPAIVVRAPGRINLLGEHTDYNEGYVLPAAIDKAIYLAMGKRSDEKLCFYSIDLADSYETDNTSLNKSSKQWSNYLLGVISEASKDGLAMGGVNVVFSGNIPLGAGLSSSAALESGMMAGLNELFKLRLDKQQIIRLAQRGENNFVGMNCGVMDMFASVMGKLNHAIRLDCRDLNYAYFPVNFDGYKLVLLDSGVKHALVNSEYNTRRKECEHGLEYFKAINPSIKALRDVTLRMVEDAKLHLPSNIYKRCKYVVEEIGRVEDACNALENNDLKRFGLLMYATHEGLKHEYEVTCPETDFLVEQALESTHVLGARQMGGGFGGCTLNLVETSHLNDFIEQTKIRYSDKYGKALKPYSVQLTDGVTVVLPN